MSDATHTSTAPAQRFAPRPPEREITDLAVIRFVSVPGATCTSCPIRDVYASGWIRLASDQRTHRAEVTGSLARHRGVRAVTSK
jgi:hypothetical protein